jgi:hypothetical protein
MFRNRIEWNMARFLFYLGHTFYFTSNLAFFLLCFSQCFISQLLFKKLDWFLINLALCILDISFLVVIYVVDFKKKKNRKKRAMADLYWMYIVSTLVQTILTFSILAGTSFVDLSTTQNGIVIESDSDRFKEYLAIIPIVSLPNIIVYFIFIGRTLFGSGENAKSF